MRGIRACSKDCDRQRAWDEELESVDLRPSLISQSGARIDCAARQGKELVIAPSAASLDLASPPAFPTWPNNINCYTIGNTGHSVRHHCTVNRANSFVLGLLRALRGISEWPELPLEAMPHESETNPYLSYMSLTQGPQGKMNRDAMLKNIKICALSRLRYSQIKRCWQSGCHDCSLACFLQRDG